MDGPFAMADRPHRRSARPAPEPSEVLLEFRRIGSVVKVTAVDPETQVEVSIQGPATASEATLRRTAITKLRYVLGRRGGAD